MKTWLAIVSLALVGCGRNAVPPVGTDLNDSERSAARKLAAAQDGFAFKVKDALLAERKEGNFCFSPLSFNLCLSLLLNGAGGDSKQILAKALGYDTLSIDEVNLGNRPLLKGMSGGQFSVANSIWLHDTIQPKQSFTEVMKSSYSADLFAGKSFGPSTVEEINAWCSNATRGMIPAIYDQLPEETFLVAVNALAFQGRWDREFDPYKTAPGQFTTEDGTKVPVSMMSMFIEHDPKAKIRCGELDGTLAAALPYVGEHFEFIVALPPAEVGARKYLGHLTPEKFHQLRETMERGSVNLQMPRFTLRTGGSLDHTMRLIGLEPLYRQFNIAGIEDRLGSGRQLAEVRQKCVLEVDEKGTRAAAVTPAASTEAASLPIVLDRPFVFALVHADTGAIVFLGLVADPRS